MTFEPEVEFLGNVSAESNVSMARTPGTPELIIPQRKKKLNLKFGSSKRTFGPSEGHKMRNKGIKEPDDGLETRRVGDLVGQEYGKVRD